MSDHQSIAELGSHSVKIHTGPALENGYRKISEPWSLGADVYQFGAISDKTKVDAIKKLREISHKTAGIQKLPAVGTGALRDAENREEFTEAVRDELGIPVHVDRETLREKLPSLFARDALRRGPAQPVEGEEATG